MTYEHFIYTDRTPSLAAAYQRAGFIARVSESGCVMVYTDYNDAVREKVVERIAKEHGADYDGGGMYVGSLEGLA